MEPSLQFVHDLIHKFHKFHRFHRFYKVYGIPYLILLCCPVSQDFEQDDQFSQAPHSRWKGLGVDVSVGKTVLTVVPLIKY